VPPATEQQIEASKSHVASARAALRPAELALVKAETPAELQEVYNLAEAYRSYTSNREQQNVAASLKLRAAAKGGEMLGARPKSRGGRGKTSDSLSEVFPGMSQPAAEQLITRWQRVAGLEATGTLKAYLQSGAEEITMAGLLAYATTGALTSSLSSEWYTPARYVEAAREVLGAIDLDPASCAEANEVVKAGRYFTAADDSLGEPWPGRVFLNPPYGKSAPQGCAHFIPKLVAEYEAGRMTAAIVLTAATGTATEWFAYLWDYVVCFTDHRLPYWNPLGGIGGLFGSAFSYLGPDPERFAARFGEFGRVVREWPAA
jgi:hypothetical protein